MAELTEEQRTILDLERTWWKFEGARARVRSARRLGLSPSPVCHSAA